MSVTPFRSPYDNYNAAITFDEIGPAYEDAFAGLAAQSTAVDWVLSRLEDKIPAKFLDIGCGTGRPVCSALAAAGHDVTGIDISGVMIAAARERVPKATFHHVDY